MSHRHSSSAHIYTDGSVSNGSVAAGITILSDRATRKFKLSHPRSSTAVKTASILPGVRYIESQSLQCWRIFLESRAALQCLSKAKERQRCWQLVVAIH